MVHFYVCPVGVAPLQVQMPALSPTMEEGNIVKWLKKEGEWKLLALTFSSNHTSHSAQAHGNLHHNLFRNMSNTVFKNVIIIFILCRLLREN